MKDSAITVTDQFCGAGGSSQGARKVLEKKGGKVAVALNHWKLAIETHNSNFPEAIHDCTDISACDPRRYPKTNILITSPECTNHSLAKGKKAVTAQLDLFDKGVLDASAERSRATMWDVPRFAEYHKYDIIIVENVVDARKWVQFPAWLHAMDLLSYNHKCVYANSMHFQPTPQSRDRMYVVFWRKGNIAPNLELTPKAFCQTCGQDVSSVQAWKNPQKKFGKYKQQYVYVCPSCVSQVEPYYFAAFNIIDWSNIGTRIGDRKKPLSENTERRIRHGLEKYGKQPLQVANYTTGASNTLHKPLSTCTTIDHNGICTPLLLHAAYSKEARGVVRPLTNTSFTQTTFESQAIAIPFLINNQQQTGIDCRVKPSSDVTPTQSTANSLGVVVPHPFIIKNEHMAVKDMSSSLLDTTKTQCTRQTMSLITPAFMVELHKTGKTRPIDNALSTVLTSGAHHGLLTPESLSSFLHYNYGKTTLSNLTDALGTATTKDRASLVSYQEPRYEDCYYRMLLPKEIKAAMAFEENYIILGSGKDQVKQLGNAVTPPAMEWIVERCVESLEK